jgi:capsular polysaccharide biosynthesis protein
LQYLSRRELERVVDGHPTLSAALATPPTVPAPVQGRGLIFLIALGLATAVSFPTALVLDCLDPCFHTPSQVIETLGIAVVLAVPKMTA